MVETERKPIAGVRFPIEGMTCASCVNRIEHHLRGLFYPFTRWLLDPIFAAAAMALSSVTVVSNALRLRGFRPSRLAQAPPRPRQSSPAAS